MLLGTDVPDELCEVAEICSGMSLISSAIISCWVHHLHELGRKNKVVVDAFKKKNFCTRRVSSPLLCPEICQVFFRWDETGKRLCLREEALRVTDVGVLENIWPVA